ncbi:UV radiation resistance protein and autophagy-related subunit 14-domain-containing protein [Lipomyces tetrasporus]|uniref:Autophagy-related protein 14 n=1 Tax=Lipomyces tetrasporus TaxID=54092 RepID=A0AAD7QL28_9ASCO|nr:UV radiation resistance protein and autophagy-related subunit 14-domain-containing protein [Lipomyces tetrasporus]KAJ8097265.1 UV radiation resistance protein and autophagy-related subunit 14-domain-containing protein [Lipomyces tetrasporus]
MAYTCGICLRADPSLTCPRCATTHVLPFRLEVISALASRSTISQSVASYLSYNASPALDTIARQKIVLAGQNNALHQVRHTLAAERTRAASLRHEVHTKAHTLSRTSTALRNAHSLQLDTITRSRERAISKVSTVRSKVRDERVRVLQDLRAAMGVVISDGKLNIGGVNIPDFGTLTGLSPRALLATMEKTCVFVTLLARYLEIQLPYEITLRPAIAIRRRPQVQQSTFRKLSVTAKINALAERERSRKELDMFLEALTLLICDIAYLCSTTSEGATADESTIDVYSYLDIAPHLWRRLGSPEVDNIGVFLDPTLVMVALREKNEVDADMRAWAEWQFVETEGSDVSNDVLLVDAPEDMEKKTKSITDEPWTDVRRRPKKSWKGVV